jgi:hypothetical protein
VADEPLRRTEARVAIRAGKLPRRAPDGVCGGPGSRRACRVCGGIITHDETGYELRFAYAGTSSLVRFYLHLQCFSAWELNAPSRSD